MKTIRKTMSLLALIIATIACNALIPKPTVTPAPTATRLPVSTSTLEPTSAAQPTEKPTQVDITPTEKPSDVIFPTPAGTPVKNWNGIPIMPNAIAGDDETQSYAFTMKAPVEEVQKFYEKELAKLGWNQFANSEGNPQTVLLMFMKGSDTLTITILSQTDGTTYVMLVK
jgi:hypothetical protein